MGIKSWKKEFYTPISNTKKGASSIEHSIRKWEGLRPENLAKHELRIDRNLHLRSSDGWLSTTFVVDEDTCALCRNYEYCCDCPIVEATGVTCHAYYGEFHESKNPEAMIGLLKDTLTGFEAMVEFRKKTLASCEAGE